MAFAASTVSDGMASAGRASLSIAMAEGGGTSKCDIVLLSPDLLSGTEAVVEGWCFLPAVAQFNVIRIAALGQSSGGGRSCTSNDNYDGPPPFPSTI